MARPAITSGRGGTRAKLRGWALGTTLACMVALAVVLFAAVSAAISHLRLVSAATNGEHAKNLAEAALAKAMVEVVKSDYKFGKNGTDRVQITIADLPGSSGIVTFDTGEFSNDGYSTFNLDNDTAVTGARSHSVPGRSVHLVARGKVGSSESWMECLYYKPPFPDGLAASGPIDAKALYLAGVRRGQAYAGGSPSTIAPDESLPANIFTNAGGPNASLLGANCRITGSAGAVGGVFVDPTSVVEGEVLPGAEPRAIPDMDIPARMSALRPNAVTVTDPNSTSTNIQLDPDWFSQATSGLTVGDLDLNGSVLLVDGNLTVAGSIKGTGVILVNGEVKIRDGRTDLTAADQVAVACTGNFTLQAQANEPNYFQGLVYCEGNFEAKDITVVGATVVNGKNGAVGSAKLDNVRFVQSPGAVTLELSKVRGIGAYDNSWAWSFTMKANPNGNPGEYLCDARAYQTDAVIPGCNKTHQHQPPSCLNVDRPSTWRGALTGGRSNDGFGSYNSSSGEITIVENPGATVRKINRTAYPDGIPVKMLQDGSLELFSNGSRTPLGEELYFFFLTLQDRNDNQPIETGKGVDGLLRDHVRVTFQQSAYSVTFNLNTLLGENIGTTRTLLWKPFR